MASTQFAVSRWLISAKLLLAAGIVFAGTPEEAVKAYMTALNKDGLQISADYIHPAELERFKGMLMPVFRDAPESEMMVKLVWMFGPGATVARLEAMTPKEFMGSFMKAWGKQVQGIKFESFEILGSVPEGDLAHVVARVGVSQSNSSIMNHMEVITTKRDGSDWKLALSDEMEGLALALKAR